MSNERFSRQADIVPRDRILDCKATVIGVGAIGRQVAIQLTAIGIKINFPPPRGIRLVPKFQLF